MYHIESTGEPHGIITARREDGKYYLVSEIPVFKDVSDNSDDLAVRLQSKMQEIWEANEKKHEQERNKEKDAKQKEHILVDLLNDEWFV